MAPSPEGGRLSLSRQGGFGFCFGSAVFPLFSEGRGTVSWLPAQSPSRAALGRTLPLGLLFGF